LGDRKLSRNATISEALAIAVYCYQKLGINDLAAQNLAILQQKFPDYLDSKGRVKIDLGPQNENRSWLNMATFNLLGSKNTQATEQQNITPPKLNEYLSWPNNW
jgi:outer membrane protein assembly factor BamD